MKNIHPRLLSRFLSLVLAVAAPLLLFSGCQSQQSEKAPSTPAASAVVQASTPLTADEALARLMEGNQRFVSGRAIHPNQTVERRAALAGGQTPIAIVLTCSDSRVAPELYFDQGLGDLFVIRNAGNVLDDHALGSMEYAVDHLHVPLILVVGHGKCGAVSAAVAGAHAPGHIQSIVDSIAPVVDGIKDQPGDKLDNAVRANARHVAEAHPADRAHPRPRSPRRAN